MSTEKMTSDEQLDYKEYTDAKTTIHQKNCAETNDRVKRTLTVRQFMLGMLVTSVVTALLTGLIQWNSGYGVAKFFGILNNDTPSGSEMYAFIEAQHKKDDHERELSARYHALKEEVIAGQREQIEKLNNELDRVTKERDALHDDTHILADKWHREKTKYELELGAKMELQQQYDKILEMHISNIENLKTTKKP